MSCKTLNPNFTTSEASTKSWFRSRGLIDKFLNITDLNGFRKQNAKWSKIAQKEYDTEGMLFAEENGKALPNKESFRKIDDFKGIKYEQRTSKEAPIDLEEFEEQRQKLQSIMGLKVVYDNTIPQSATVKGRTIVANPDKLFRDTLVHEVGHVLIDSIGGLDNPMVRRGIEQLENTTLAREVRERYKDQPEDIIKKEILATAIGMEGADIFGAHVGNVATWKRWLEIFLNRVKQVLGIQPSIARQMASQIIYHNPSSGRASTKYERRDRRTKELEDEIKDIQANLRAEINELESQEYENYENRVASLERLIKRLSTAHLEVSVTSYIEIASQRIQELLDEVRQDGLTFDDLRRIKDDLSPYENVTELQNRLIDLDLEDGDPVFDNIGRAVQQINFIENEYRAKAKELLADKLAPAENGTIHQRYLQKFRDEFDSANTDFSMLGFRQKRFLNGKQVSKGEYNAARTAYVQQKMDQNRDKIIAEERDYLHDAMLRTPSDIGWIEHVAFDTEAINDEIIQIVTELVVNADREVQNKYLEKEGEIYRLWSEYKKNNPTPNNQQKRWDFMLADELDVNGNPTGKKAPFLTTDYNASFLVHKRKFLQDKRDTAQKVADLHPKFIANREKYREEYDQALKERDEADDRYSAWLSKNTIKLSNKRTIPTKKWKIEQDLNEDQKNMRSMMMELLNEAEDMLPAIGKLRGQDANMGEYIRIPSISKTTIEKITDGDVAKNLLETIKDVYTPRPEDVEYESEGQAVSKRTRDGKFHHSIPIHYRKETTDQSFDVLSALMMNYHMALNYKHKRMIESEVIALKDIARKRDIEQTTFSFGKGLRSITNWFSKEDKKAVKLDTDEEIAKSYKVLKALIDARMYGVRRKGPEALNKIVDSAISFTSDVIMPGNIFSMVSNVVMGKSSSAIEILGENTPIERSDYLAAEKEYWENVPNTLGDFTKPKVDSFMSKLIEKYDAMGDFFGPTLRWAEDSRFTQFFKRGTAYILMRMSEHYISGTLTIASLKGMKLQNENGEFITTEGKVTKDRNKAASMYDLHAIENGEIVFKEIQGAYKTDHFDAKLGTPEHDRLTKNYIRDIVAQTQGQYDSKSFSMSQLNIFGRMFFGLRQWIGRGFAKHWRGATYVFNEEIPETAKFRAKVGKPGEIGYQTQFFHTANKSRKAMIQYFRGLLGEGERLTFDIVSKPWKELTPTELGNVRRAVSTYAMAAVSAALGTLLMNLEDDDDELPDEVIYLVFALERTKQELMFFTNPMETLKILRSPAASISMVRNVVRLVEQASSDLWGGEIERYEQGRFENRAKIEKQLTDLVPIWSQFNRDVRTSLSYIQSSSAAD